MNIQPPFLTVFNDSVFRFVIKHDFDISYSSLFDFMRYVAGNCR